MLRVGVNHQPFFRDVYIKCKWYIILYMFRNDSFEKNKTFGK